MMRVSSPLSVSPLAGLSDALSVTHKNLLSISDMVLR